MDLHDSGSALFWDDLLALLLFGLFSLTVLLITSSDLAEFSIFVHVDLHVVALMLMGKEKIYVSTHLEGKGRCWVT